LVIDSHADSHISGLYFADGKHFTNQGNPTSIRRAYVTPGHWHNLEVTVKFAGRTGVDIHSTIDGKPFVQFRGDPKRLYLKEKYLCLEHMGCFGFRANLAGTQFKDVTVTLLDGKLDFLRQGTGPPADTLEFGGHFYRIVKPKSKLSWEQAKRVPSPPTPPSSCQLDLCWANKGRLFRHDGSVHMCVAGMRLHDESGCPLTAIEINYGHSLRIATPYVMGIWIRVAPTIVVAEDES